MLGQCESMPSHLSVSGPSQFSSDPDFVNISDIADIAFLFLGIQGKSGIFFNFGFITLVKRFILLSVEPQNNNRSEPKQSTRYFNITTQI